MEVVGFNGKERDNEVNGFGNSYDFGARMYDSRLGKFLSLEPYAARFPSESHYGFAGNSPIYYVDHEGAFKLHPDIARSYPAVYTYLSKQIEQDVMNSTYIKRAYKVLIKDLDDDKIRETFANGNGPSLSAVKVPGDGMFDALGHTSKDGNDIQVNTALFQYANDALTNKGGNFTEDQQIEALTLLYTVILHEGAHSFDEKMVEPKIRHHGSMVQKLVMVWSS